MGLNIKSAETEQLERELARQNGETATMAVTFALKEGLERQKTNPKAGLAAWLDELTKNTAPLLKNLPPSDKVGDLLYDKETGLPKGCE
ncbi:MAG: type II toxin-antitoxin system VapB family antitoxin [Terracidiphilus sp.]